MGGDLQVGWRFESKCYKTSVVFVVWLAPTVTLLVCHTHLRRRSVRPSVRPPVNTCNSAINFRIFFKIGGNIPLVNITVFFFSFL